MMTPPSVFPIRSARAWLASLAALLGLVGCSPAARYSATDAGPVVDGGQDFSALDRYLDERLAAGLSGFAMQVVDAEGRVVYRREAGACSSAMCPSGDPDFTVQLVTGVASSTKWVTSTVVLAALDEGVAAGRWESISAALDTPVVPELGCGDVSGPIAGVTLRQLLSFNSGVIADHDCVDSGETLQGCACEILRDSASATTANLFVEQSACTRTAPTVHGRRGEPASRVRCGRAGPLDYLSPPAAIACAHGG